MMTTPSIDLGLGIDFLSPMPSAVPMAEGVVPAAVSASVPAAVTVSAFAPAVVSDPVFDAAAVKAFDEALATPIRENVIIQAAFESATKAFADSIAPVVRREVKSAVAVPTEKPVVVVVPDEKPVVVAPVVVEKPEGIVPAEKPVVAQTVVEKPVAEVVPDEKPVVVVVPAEKPVAVAPVVVEKPEVVVPAEKPVVAQTVVEKPVAVVVPTEKPVVVPTVIVERPKKVEVAVAPKETPASDEPDQLSAVVTPIAIDAALDSARRAAVQPVSGPAPAVTGVDAVSARTIEVAERVAKVTSEMDVLVQAADAVVDTMLVSPGLMRGEGEVRVILKPDVLCGSELRIAVSGRQMEVEFIVPAADIAVLVERCRPQLEQQLVAKIHAFDIGVKVSGPAGRPSRRRDGDYS